MDSTRNLPMSTPTGYKALAQIEALRTQCAQLRASVDGARLLDQVIEVVQPLLYGPEPTYDIVEAAPLSGYSVGHLRRLVRQGNIPNRGRPRRIRVLLSECPKKGRKRAAGGAS